MKAPIDVELTTHEMERARHVAEARCAASVNLKNAHGFDGDSMAINLSGAAGELAFCRALGFVWDESVNVFKRPDVGTNIQIRTAPCKAKFPPKGFGRLIVREADDPRDYFCLVVGNIPYFSIVGWIKGCDAMNDEYLREEVGRPPAWFVPADVLNKDLGVLISE